MFNNKNYVVAKKLEDKVVVIENNKNEKKNFEMTKLDKNYIKPQEGSIQDNMTTTEMIESVKGYRKLYTIAEKEILKNMPLFKTRVKYYDTIKKKFRTGGVLVKVEYPKYIMLMNIVTKAGWSVQLEHNMIFVPEEMIDKEIKQTELNKEKNVKDKLYKLYKGGDIIRKDKC